MKVEKAHIVTDAWYQIDETGGHAIGDVARRTLLAHRASREGVLCVERSAGSTLSEMMHESVLDACSRVIHK